MEATAQTANLSAANAAKIYVRKVEQQPQVSEDNTSKVSVGNWQRGWIKKSKSDGVCLVKKT